MQAITIKYLPATNTKGSRYKATAAAGSITLGYDHGLDSEGNVRAVVTALVKKLGWDTQAPGVRPYMWDRADTWHIGATADGHWVAVRASHCSKV